MLDEPGDGAGLGRVEPEARPEMREVVTRLKALFAAGELPTAPSDVHLGGGAPKSTRREDVRIRNGFVYSS